MSGLDALAVALSQWRSAIFAHQGDAESRALTDARMTQHIELLRGISMTLAGVAPDSLRQYPL